ncbi:hypothetical protein PVOR_11605 [Paenibacillus vortex V453]|uniref:Uncharacterized protein n=1 Tax=Paenibacillus vortex V453 TaxID=715225 RepID=A0A2R9SW75_9BACL|nr:hypothetical protein PVOR_11605 [Paenibacillus vortex V453]
MVLKVFRGHKVFKEWLAFLDPKVLKEFLALLAALPDHKAYQAQLELRAHKER